MQSSVLLPDCVRFSCCSPIASLVTAVRRFHPLLAASLTCVRFGCSFPISTAPRSIACASAAAPARAPRLRPLQQQLPDCVRFGCCSPMASASTAALRLHPLNSCSLLTCACSGRFQTFFVEFEVIIILTPPVLLLKLIFLAVPCIPSISDRNARPHVSSLAMLRHYVATPCIKPKPMQQGYSKPSSLPSHGPLNKVGPNHYITHLLTPATPYHGHHQHHMDTTDTVWTLETL